MILTFFNAETRPRSCLVFVNPDGGAKKGLKIWTDKVEPLFRLAGVTLDVVGNYLFNITFNL